MTGGSAAHFIMQMLLDYYISKMRLHYSMNIRPIISKWDYVFSSS
jgi:hypothetical protein